MRTKRRKRCYRPTLILTLLLQARARPFTTRSEAKPRCTRMTATRVAVPVPAPNSLRARRGSGRGRRSERSGGQSPGFTTRTATCLGRSKPLSRKRRSRRLSRPRQPTTSASSGTEPRARGQGTLRWPSCTRLMGGAGRVERVRRSELQGSERESDCAVHCSASSRVAILALTLPKATPPLLYPVDPQPDHPIATRGQKTARSDSRWPAGTRRT